MSLGGLIDRYCRKRGGGGGIYAVARKRFPIKTLSATTIPKVLLRGTGFSLDDIISGESDFFDSIDPS